MTEPRPSNLGIRVLIRFRGFLNPEGSMQTKQLSLFLSLLLTLCLFYDTQAQQAGQIESMKLLTADTGWAATRNKLFWTADGGASWKDITPKLNHKHQILSSVFFLDVSRGWALLSCSDDRDIAANNSCFALASTADAGETWSVAQEKIAHAFSREQLEDGYGFSGRSWLDFVGSQHGWEILEILDIATSSANPSAGEMLRTVDGGKDMDADQGYSDIRSLHLCDSDRRMDSGREGPGSLRNSRLRGLLAKGFAAQAFDCRS
jgi:hypothetical protein